MILAPTMSSLAVFGIGRSIVGRDYLPSADNRSNAIVGALVTVLAVFIVARRDGIDWRRLFGPRVTRATLPLTLVMAPVALLTLAAALATYIPLSHVAPRFTTWLLEPRELFHADTIAQWLLLMIVGVVAAPFMEEVVFRGILMQRWAHKWGTTTGVVASSTLFGILHQEWIGHFLFGVALCALYLRTRSLWLPIVAHGINNFVFLMPGLRQAIDHTPEKVQTIPDLRADGIWLAPLLSLGLLLGWLYLRKFWAPGQLRAVLRGPVPYDVHEPVPIPAIP